MVKAILPNDKLCLILKVLFPHGKECQVTSNIINIFYFFKILDFKKYVFYQVFWPKILPIEYFQMLSKVNEKV